MITLVLIMLAASGWVLVGCLLLRDYLLRQWLVDHLGRLEGGLGEERRSLCRKELRRIRWMLRVQPPPHPTDQDQQ